MKALSLGVQLLCCILLADITRVSSAAAAGATSNNAKLIASIDNVVNTAMECHNTMGLSLAVVKDGVTILSKGYGRTKATNGQATSCTTKFAIGSLTKAFTGLLAAKITSEHSTVTLDTPLSQYITDFQQSDEYRSKNANLKDLLCHRMGIRSSVPPILAGFDPAITTQELLKKRVPHLSAKDPFRTSFSYSNLMYFVAANALSQLSQGKAWKDLVRDEILTPLEMTNSGFADEVKDYSGFAYPNNKVGTGFVDLDPNLFRTLLDGGGSIYTTADDMTKWMNFLMKQTSISGINNEMITKVFTACAMGYLSKGMAKPKNTISEQDFHYGLGWTMGLYRGYRRMYHTGTIVTYRSYVWLFPDVNVGIFASVNGPADWTEKDNLLKGLVYHISDLVNGFTPWFQPEDLCKTILPWKTRPDTKLTVAPIKTISLSDNDLAKFIGKYTHDVYGDACVYKKNNNLMLKHGRYGQLQLLPETATRFHVVYSAPLDYINEDFYFQTRVDFVLVGSNNNVASLSMKRKFTWATSTGPFRKLPETCSGV